MGRRNWHLSLVVSILRFCFLLTQGQGKTGIRIMVDPNELREGQSVTLTPGNVNLKQFRGCTWFRGTLESKNRIFTYDGDEQLNGPAFTGRENVIRHCSLHITLLRLNDSGIYTLAVGLPVILETGNATVTVSEILSIPVLWPAESLVEENSTVTLHCNTSDRLDVSIGWSKDGNPVPTKAVLSDQKRTLTLTGITKEDEGIYMCWAVNPVSNALSNPSKITVASSSPSSSAGALAGTVIGSLAAILLLSFVFLCVRHRNDKTSTPTSAVTSTPQLYENILSVGQMKPEIKSESSSEAAKVYMALQPRIESVYEEIKR